MMRNAMIPILAVAFSICVAGAAQAQVVPQQGADVTQLLQSLGGLGALQGFLGGTDTTTTDTTTTTPPTTTQPVSGESQPTIVSNQFTTTSSGALNERAPGRMVQQAIALQSGTVELSGDVTEEVNFFRDTFNKIIDQTLGTISDALTGINTLLGLASGGGVGTGTGTGTIGTIPNAATSGQGQSIPIN